MLAWLWTTNDPWICSLGAVLVGQACQTMILDLEHLMESGLELTSRKRDTLSPRLLKLS